MSQSELAAAFGLQHGLTPEEVAMIGDELTARLAPVSKDGPTRAAGTSNEGATASDLAARPPRPTDAAGALLEPLAAEALITGDVHGSTTT